MATKKKEQYNYWWLVALGLVPVLLLVWWRGEVENSSSDEASAPENVLEERWPSPSLPEEAQGPVSDAMEHACEGAAACHVLWADHSDDEGFTLVASMDDEERFWAHPITSEGKDGEPTELNAAEPYEFTSQTPALPVEVHSQDWARPFPAWLFPEGANDFGLLRHDTEEEVVVADEPRELPGEHMDRVVVFDDADSPPLLRYQYAGRTLYTLGGDQPLCVGEDDARCLLSFPSEGALVSLSPVLTSLTADRELELTLEFDEEVDLAPDIGGTVEEPLSGGTAHVARLNWQEVSSDSDSDSTEAPREYAYAVYFDDGTPAARSMHVTEAQETVLGEAPEEDGDSRVSGVAIFPDLFPDEETLVAVAFHPPGYRAPLLAPEPDTAHDGDEVTVYEPTSDQELLPLSYIERDGDDRPVVSGWLDGTANRPG